MSKFKTGDYYLCKANQIVEIVNDKYNLPFIIVKELYSNVAFKVNENLLEQKVIKYLGNNSPVVRSLYMMNDTERDIYEKQMRQMAKAFTFAVNYGTGGIGIAIDIEGGGCKNSRD